MMSKKIKISESQIKFLIKNIISEQTQSDPKVTAVQTALKNAGEKYGKILGTSGPKGDGVDGVFGTNTKNAVIQYQIDNKITPAKGVVGPITAGKLKVEPLTTGGTKTTQGKAGGLFFSKDAPEDKKEKSGGLFFSKDVPKSKEEVKKKEISMAKAITGIEKSIDPNAYLTFDGSKLSMMGKGGLIKSWKAESGLTFFNTPLGDWPELFKRYTTSKDEWSKDKDAGPTPPGKYIVGPLQARGKTGDDVSFFQSVSALWDMIVGNTPTDKEKAFDADTKYSKIGWGNFRLAIKPQKGTNTFGRGSFFIHGGKFAGSHGCIDLTNQMDDFAKIFGTWSASTKKKTIPLVVNYGESKNSFLGKFWAASTDVPPTQNQQNAV